MRTVRRQKLRDSALYMRQRPGQPDAAAALSTLSSAIAASHAEAFAAPSSKAGDAVDERLRELETEVLTSPVMRAL